MEIAANRSSPYFDASITRLLNGHFMTFYVQITDMIDINFPAELHPKIPKETPESTR